MDSYHLCPFKACLLVGYIYICMHMLRPGASLTWPYPVPNSWDKGWQRAGPNGSISFRDTFFFSLPCTEDDLVNLDSQCIFTVAKAVFPLLLVSFKGLGWFRIGGTILKQGKNNGKLTSSSCRDLSTYAPAFSSSHLLVHPGLRRTIAFRNFTVWAVWKSSIVYPGHLELFTHNFKKEINLLKWNLKMHFI